jgi:vancomycin resistance protein YoaR
MRPAASARATRTEPTDETGTDTNRRRLKLALAATPVVLLVLLIVAWAVDTTVLSGQVVRNVEVAGRSIGGKGEDSLPEVVSSLADELAARPVTIRTRTPEAQGGRSIGQTEETTYTTTAEALGLALDEDAFIEAALDVRRGDAFFIRPFKWLGSFFGSNEVPLEYTVDELQTAGAMQVLQGASLAPSTEPTVKLSEGAFVAVPGQAGRGIDTQDVVETLPDAAAAVEGTEAHEPIVIEVDQSDIRPRFTDQEAQAVADRANTMTAQGLTIQADTASVALTTDQLREWIVPTTTADGPDLSFNAQAAKDALPLLLGGLEEPRNASVTLEGGTPVVSPGQNGVALTLDGADTLIWDALNAGETTVELDAEVSEPEWTTEEVTAWGITQPVGGSRAWQSGADISGPAPGFTTYHAGGEPRVTNIHRMADLVQGAVIPPGESFSINDHVGRRTTANGFVEAGAIREGVHVPEVGGGTSQFATTLFNAAYFAGLDITTYQSHTEYFSRYPRGREATMGYPAPDLVIENNTPYGVLIWPSYTSTSLTVTLYSTPYATGEQTGITQTPSGACNVVTTTRTRTYPDGETDRDTFRATYRPGENLNCEGQPITPTTTTVPPAP